MKILSAEYSFWKVVSGSLLVAGTTIGAGMLALPLASAVGGFMPAIFLYLICWIVSLITGFLFLEIVFQLDKGANLITMAATFLGKRARQFAWCMYVFLFYTLTVAYVSGGGGLTSDILGLESMGVGSVLFTLVFGTTVALGSKYIDKVNLILVLGLIITYVFFFVVGCPYVNFTYLLRYDAKNVVTALPVIFATFSYQGIIPSLVQYVDGNKQMARQCVFYGTAVPCLVYILWDALIKGIVPLNGEYGLLATAVAEQTAAYPLAHLFPGSTVSIVAQYFGFFALTTSFLGVTLGLIDFFADGFQMKKHGVNVWLLASLVFIPPLLVSLVDSTLFISALRYAGGFGCVVLLGFYPVAMVYSSRYIRMKKAEHEVPFGKSTLACLMIFLLFVIYVTL